MTARINHIYRKYVSKVGECELCGSKRDLELHHKIPLSCGGLECDENYICVCRVCHTKLTPQSLLTKIGINNAKRRNDLVTAICRSWEQASDYGITPAEVCENWQSNVNAWEEKWDI